MTARSRHQTHKDARDEVELDGRMGFLDHLAELRKRVIRSVVAIVAFMQADRGLRKG